MFVMLLALLAGCSLVRGAVTPSPCEAWCDRIGADGCDEKDIPREWSSPARHVTLCTAQFRSSAAVQATCTESGCTSWIRPAN